MTIEEGTGDEFLLTCFVCKNPFGLVAQFCGYCQATRQQALGVERARPGQGVIAVSSSQPKPEPGPATTPPVTQPSEPKFLPPTSQKERPQPKPALQNSRFQENIQLRTKSVESWQKKNSKFLATLGLISFLFSTYFSIQSVIFTSNTPAETAEAHLQLGVLRDSRYFEGFSDNSGIRFFPSRFSAWNDSKAGNWVTTASWNGWTGKASVDFLAGGTGYSGTPVTAKYVAEYESFLGIFRKINWKAEAPATISLQYPQDKQLSIYINGLAAGTVLRPAVSEGVYQMYPGEFEIKFYDMATGEEATSFSRYYFIDAYGTYDLNFG